MELLINLISSEDFHFNSIHLGKNLWQL